MGSAEIVIVGSINMDVSVLVPSLPRPGETIVGSDALWSGGGKGANQAVGAARLGRRVAMVGAVGADSTGSDLLERLASDSIDTSEVISIDGVSTGIAMIVVDEAAENSIVVSPGANSKVTEAMVRESSVLRDCDLAMVQFEIPEDAANALAEVCPGRILVNPAPARPMSPELLMAARVIIPNEGELASMVGQAEAANVDEVADQARLVETGGDLVITLGSKGALVVTGGEVRHVAAVPAEAIDTTAAGDSFCAAVADGLVGGLSVVEAASWATKVAAVTVANRGAQDSLPTMQHPLWGQTP